MGLTVAGDTLMLTPDAGFLAKPGARFPIVIDPTVTKERSSWSMITEKVAIWNNSTENAQVGYDSKDKAKWRSFYRFDTNILKGASISKAVFAHKQIHSAKGCNDSTGVPGVDLWRTNRVTSSTKWSDTNASGFYDDKLATSTVAHGTSTTCPGFTRTEWDVTRAAVDSAANSWDDLTFGLRSASEGDAYGWREFDNDATYPELTVTYNRAPNVPGAVTLTGATDYKGSKFLNDSTPKMSAVVSDPDGGVLHAKFIVNPMDGAGDFNDRIYSNSENVPSGSTATKELEPGLALLDGQGYDIYARGQDESLESISGAGNQVTIDLAKPAAPTATAPVPPTVGDSFNVTFGAVSADTASYLWGVNTDVPLTTAVPATLGGPATVTEVAPKVGQNSLTVIAVDRAGNRSTTTSVAFNVTDRLPHHRYRLDKNGADTRTNTAPGSSVADLTVPAAGTAWGEGRDYRNVDNSIRDCKDWGLTVSPSAVVKNITGGDPGNTSAATTITAWVKPAELSTVSSGTGYEGLAVSAYTGKAAALALGYRKAASTDTPTWTLSIDTDGTAGNRSYVTSTATATTGKWTHLAAVWNPTTKKAQLYVNGNRVADQALAANPFDATKFMVGGSPVGDTTVGWNGTVDESLVYGGALDAAQIATLYQARRSPGCS